MHKEKNKNNMFRTSQSKPTNCNKGQ
uniref:Uncharacterized protein n=1 Tax=Arundo donax TaxID=35708 RepID=A0A0A9C206_ARUDO